MRPKPEDEDAVDLFKRKNWKFGMLLDQKERIDNNRILREILAAKLTKKGVPAHLARRAVSLQRFATALEQSW